MLQRCIIIVQLTNVLHIIVTCINGHIIHTMRLVFQQAYMGYSWASRILYEHVA